MIEFFEFLNGCSPQRTFAYLVFILLFTFILFSGVAEMIRRIMGNKSTNHYHFNDSDMTDEEIEDSVKDKEE